MRMHSVDYSTQFCIYGIHPALLTHMYHGCPTLFYMCFRLIINALHSAYLQQQLLKVVCIIVNCLLLHHQTHGISFVRINIHHGRWVVHVHFVLVAALNSPKGHNSEG